MAVPAVIAAYFLHSSIWIAVIPAALILLMILTAVLPIRRKITPQQFAEPLEPHLLGTDGPWGWDDATSVRLADESIEHIRVRWGQ